MEDLYFSVNLENGHTLCLAPLTDRRLELAGDAVSDPSGYFLYEQTDSSIEVIAQVFSLDAVLRLRAMFNMQ